MEAPKNADRIEVGWIVLIVALLGVLVAGIVLYLRMRAPVEPGSEAAATMLCAKLQVGGFETQQSGYNMIGTR